MTLSASVPNTTNQQMFRIITIERQKKSKNYFFHFFTTDTAKRLFSFAAFELEIPTAEQYVHTTFRGFIRIQEKNTFQTLTLKLTFLSWLGSNLSRDMEISQGCTC